VVCQNWPSPRRAGRCIPEVAARVYDPSAGRLLPQLLLGERAAVAEQLGGEPVVGRLEQRADLLLDEPGAARVAGARVRDGAAAVGGPGGGRRGAGGGGRRRPELRDGGRPRRDVVVDVDQHVCELLPIQQHRTAC